MPLAPQPAAAEARWPGPTGAFPRRGYAAYMFSDVRVPEHVGRVFRNHAGRSWADSGIGGRHAETRLIVSPVAG